MNDKERSSEDLIAENTVLRHELEICRTRENQDPGAEAAAKGDLCSTLVSEVPEYLYSIDFIQGKIVATFHSPQCEEITGYRPCDYTINPNLWMDMIHEKDRERVRIFLQNLREPLHCKSIEHRIIHKDGSVRWVLNMSTVHKDINGSTVRQSGFLIDVSGRREEDERNMKLLDETRRNSFTDDLTQLYNRHAFRVLTEQQVLVAERINHSVLLFFIDVDGLKHINDTLGHGAGDKVLIGLAEILKCTFRESDIISRIGGDEFAVLSMEMGPDSSDRLLERLQTNIEKKKREEIDAAELSVSAGVSRYVPNGSDSVTSLLDRADKDMYARKTRKFTAYARAAGLIVEKENTMKKVLLVDDNDALLFAFKKLSRSYDFSVETANSLETALKLLSAGHYDVLISDLNLTGLSRHEGFEIVKTAKRHNQDINAYIWTAYEGEIEREEAARIGVRKILAKPVTFNTLLSVIDEDTALTRNSV
jgi:diguanylate cyclase (GGDEF)-like protein/PAS domain S-box-containing protein